LFAVNTDGTGLTNLHSFGLPGDGISPRGVFILSSNRLYGTTHGDGSSLFGTVFAVNTDGTDFTNLHTFTRGDGQGPVAGLLLSGNTLYGATYLGGRSGDGTVFKVNTDSTGFTNLYHFTGGNDGDTPQAGLTLSGDTLYGTATGGGSSSNGTVFALNTNGTGFRILHSFTATPPYPNITNSDGARPVCELVLSDNHLYGTTSAGGSSGNGTVFALTTDGTGFTTLHSFTALSAPFSGTNSDGISAGSLILSGNTLYGTAEGGGSSGKGTVFAMNTNGTGFTTLHSFLGYPNDGHLPRGGLILSGNTLYGTTQGGGSSANGTVFSLSFRPQLTITPSGVPPSRIILSWPTRVAGFDYAGYRLQSAPALTGPFTDIPAATSPYTKNITAPQQFFRLCQ
jgi:uncharacterized repeat protein (TIGR03803 family)